MVSTKWMEDNCLLIYEDDVLAGTGKLVLIDGKYFIENVSIEEEFRGKSYGELAVRMLVRRAVNMGAEKTYANIDKSIVKLFEKIGFYKQEETDNGDYLMCMEGDVGGYCCK
ncbi:GNAT family N-acetyltransferase [Sedimentibacter sp.]|uniref:GNAT family N-acetyltransferase n=1 Tax=Sedimentibacter sp. TaxID=1960295 RepID=UPI0028AFB1D7|nr:GNAT family N-acetyltransferase [Sedimentibacter sp.]